MTFVAPTSVVAPAFDPQEAALNKAIKQAWKRFVHETHASADQHAVYALLRGRALDKAFSPLVRPSKILGAGGDPNRARKQAQAAAVSLNVKAWAAFASMLEGVPTRYGCYQRQPHPLLDRVAVAATEAA